MLTPRYFAKQSCCWCLHKVLCQVKLLLMLTPRYFAKQSCCWCLYKVLCQVKLLLMLTPRHQGTLPSKVAAGAYTKVLCQIKLLLMFTPRYFAKQSCCWCLHQGTLPSKVTADAYTKVLYISLHGELLIMDKIVRVDWPSLVGNAQYIACIRLKWYLPLLFLLLTSADVFLQLYSQISSGSFCITDCHPFYSDDQHLKHWH